MPGQRHPFPGRHPTGRWPGDAAALLPRDAFLAPPRVRGRSVPAVPPFSQSRGAAVAGEPVSSGHGDLHPRHRVGARPRGRAGNQGNQDACGTARRPVDQAPSAIGQRLIGARKPGQPSAARGGLCLSVPVTGEPPRHIMQLPAMLSIPSSSCSASGARRRETRPQGPLQAHRAFSGPASGPAWARLLRPLPLAPASPLPPASQASEPSWPNPPLEASALAQWPGSAPVPPSPAACASWHTIRHPCPPPRPRSLLCRWSPTRSRPAGPPSPGRQCIPHHALSEC
mmetsp:Transcript_25068/g.70209  ORF Transcript_25068/g.70209 Transcript_25068/m.70209 type:complete len:284 (-) Transcript_25068:659-1510(-)